MSLQVSGKGKVAYRLLLRSASRVHPMYHIYMSSANKVNSTRSNLAEIVGQKGQRGSGKGTGALIKLSSRRLHMGRF